MGLAEKFGPEKVAWIKRIFAGFLIISLTRFGAPFIYVITNLGLNVVWVDYILAVYEAGTIFLTGIIIAYFGKPLYVVDTSENEEEITEEVEETILETKEELEDQVNLIQEKIDILKSEEE